MIELLVTASLGMEIARWNPNQPEPVIFRVQQTDAYPSEVCLTQHYPVEWLCSPPLNQGEIHTFEVELREPWRVCALAKNSAGISEVSNCRRHTDGN